MKINLLEKKPFYIQIRDDILEKIETNYWKEGDLIPPEMELAKSYGVSRVTIRKAISYLVKENYLKRIAGFGTYVLQNRPSLHNFTLIQSFTNEMREMGLPSKTLTASVEKIEATPKLAEIFNINIGDTLVNLKRTRGSKVPILFSDTYLLPYIEIPNDKNILYGSLYEFLAKNNIFFSKFEEYVGAVPLTIRLKEILKITDDSPILRRKRYSFDEENKLIEYTETFYNSKLYEYRTRLIYRKK
ncbi:MAG: hypothetical protein B6I17_03630 [Tenericutes bacterium 4572_104]|nr:MAG: hypothetical protein B6I17_03630 [Tenericutes bacterium 4572_104]